MDSNELLREPAEREGSMTGTSPVTPVDQRVASHVVAFRRLGVTGLAPVMLPSALQANV